jgi:hypothetical protein
MGEFAVNVEDLPFDQEVTLNKPLTGKYAKGSLHVKITKVGQY